MKRLCCDRKREACEALKHTLEAEGIACLVKHDETPSLFEGRDANPVNPMPELWIVDDEQFEQAWKLLSLDEEDEAHDDGADD